MRPTRLPMNALLAIGAALVAADAAPAAAPPVVTILGDSITAGYGLPEAAALPAQLQDALHASGLDATVRGAGVSGDTAEGGLARVGFSVQSDTALCIVELGANDYLQSIPPAETRRSLAGIVQALKARHIRVLLLGGKVSAANSGTYATEFDAIFPTVASAEHVALDPDFLAGISSNPSLKQPDGIHPNASGVRLMAGHLAPAVVDALHAPAA